MLHKALLDYYRARTNVKTPDINLNKSDYRQGRAAVGRRRLWSIHSSYIKAISLRYNYGEDINWQYWPVTRQRTPLAACTVTNGSLRWVKAYRVSGDEKYAKEWAASIYRLD